MGGGDLGQGRGWFWGRYRIIRNRVPLQGPTRVTKRGTLGVLHDAGALVIRIGFWAILWAILYKRTPQN